MALCHTPAALARLKNGRMKKVIVFTIPPLLLAWLFLPATGWGTEKWFVSLYGGRFSNNALLDIVRFQTQFEDSSIYVLSVGKEVGQYKDKISFEWEGQIALHSGRQDHEEVNAVFILRWLPFVWDRFLDTSLAIGNGLSYATVEPPLEILDSDTNKSSQWLYYLLVELAFRLPTQNEWDLFVRVHHRSGVFGLINDVDSGSNFIGCGIRYKF